MHSWLVGAVGCAGGISFGYEPPIVSGLIVQSAFTQFFDSSSNSSSNDAEHPHGASYCRLNSLALQLYISGLFVAAAVSTAIAIAGVDRFGRRRFMIVGALLILVANAVQTAATGRAMLIAGRLIMGLGQGFATFTVPMYVSEMSPAAVRGRFGTAYSISTTVGQALGYAVNQAVHASGMAQGWRIPFAAAAWCPLAVLLLMAFALPDTPSSLLQRGRHSQARRAFDLVRHSSAAGQEQEWQAMAGEAALIQLPRDGCTLQQQQAAVAKDGEAAAVAVAPGKACAASGSRHSSSDIVVDAEEQGPGAALGHQPECSNSSGKCTSGPPQHQEEAEEKKEEPPPWPAFVITWHLTVMRCWNGFVSVMFFSAVLFSASGNSVGMSLLAQTLMGLCALLGGVVAMTGIDRIGRQPLLTWFGALMAGAMAAAAAILAAGLPAAAVAAGRSLTPTLMGLLLAMLCLWQLAYWSSWAPCFYVMMSELYPLRSRARAVGCGMILFNLATFLVLLLGGVMLCRMTYGLLLFYAVVDAYLALFAQLCMPETKGMPLQAVTQLYRSHWLWRHTKQ